MVSTMMHAIRVLHQEAKEEFATQRCRLSGTKTYRSCGLAADEYISMLMYATLQAGFVFPHSCMNLLELYIGASSGGAAHGLMTLQSVVTRILKHNVSYQGESRGVEVDLEEGEANEKQEEQEGARNKVREDEAQEDLMLWLGQQEAAEEAIEILLGTTRNTTGTNEMLQKQAKVTTRLEIVYPTVSQTALYRADSWRAASYKYIDYQLVFWTDIEQRTELKLQFLRDQGYNFESAAIRQDLEMAGTLKKSFTLEEGEGLCFYILPSPPGEY
jgi:hypothetical protein